MKRLCITIRGLDLPSELVISLEGFLREQGVCGLLIHHSDKLALDVEGSLDGLPHLVGTVQKMVSEAPCDAQLSGYALPWFGYNEFSVRPRGERDDFGQLPRDRSLCSLCEEEVLDPLGRRENHALASCPACGPRFTTMANAEKLRDSNVLGRYLMCLDCEREVASPHHPRGGFLWNSCPVCGPQVVLVNPAGNLVPGDPIDEAAWALREGHVLAVKSPGGYRLTCDATNSQAVATLRKAKGREEQALPVMVRDLDQAESLARLSDKERYWLGSEVGPIVICSAKNSNLQASIHPGLKTIGLCLPASALEVLLFEAFDMPPLVCSQARHPGDWPTISDYEVVRQFRRGVDLFLMHTEPIVSAMPPSVLRVTQEGELWLSRGYGLVPQSSNLEGALNQDTLALGGLADYAFALGRDSKAVLSPSYGAFYKDRVVPVAEESLGHFLMTHDHDPERIVMENTAGLMGGRLAEKLSHSRLDVLPHTHAHAAALASEYPDQGPMLVAVLDQGAELNAQNKGDADFIFCEASTLKSVGWFQDVPKPEAPSGDCWKQALVTLDALWPDGDWLRLPIWNRVEETTKEITLSVSRHDDLSRTTSPLRLLQTLSVVCDLCSQQNYPRQCILEMDALADLTQAKPYPFDLITVDKRPSVEVEGFLRAVVADLLEGTAQTHILGKVFVTIAEMIVTMAERLAPDCSRIGLTGQAFVSERLLSACVKRIREAGKTPVIHRSYPPTDQNLAIGQLQWAAWNPKDEETK